MKRTIFIGQAMPRGKRNPHDWPSLNKWLYSIGIDDDLITQHFVYSALVDYFPGSHKGTHIVPSQEDIAREHARLTRLLIDFDPGIVIPVGKLSITHCLAMEVKVLKDVVGNIFEADPYGALGRSTKIIPLPHPSGASTWRHNSANLALLDQSLLLLKKELELV